MAKKEHVNKHPDWRLSARERFNYYLSDSGRLFGTSVFQTCWPVCCWCSS